MATLRRSTALEFDRWVRQARPGDRVVYFVGDLSVARSAQAIADERERSKAKARREAADKAVPTPAERSPPTPPRAATPTLTDQRKAAVADRLARHVILHTGEELPIISPCYHIRGVERGPALVRLVQERGPGLKPRYVAVKR